MAPNYKANLQQAESELASITAARDEIRRGLTELQAEYAAFEAAMAVDVSKLPPGEVRAAVSESTRAAIEGPALASTIAEFRKRLDKANSDVGQATHLVGMARADLATADAAALLVKAPEVTKALATLDQAMGLYPASWSGLQGLYKQLEGVRRGLAELLDSAKKLV